MQNKIVNLFFSTILVVSIFLCGGRVAFDVFAATTDTTAPVLKDITVSPSIISIGSYFILTVSASDDSSGVKTANVILESPSGQSILHAELSHETSNSWRSAILMPFGSESGSWKVKSVYLADNSGNDTTLYYGNQINYTFKAEAGSTTSYQTTNGTACTSFGYGSWSSCQKNGTQTRAITSSYPSGCVGGSPLLVQSCKYLYQCNDDRPYLDVQNKDNCTNSRGTWDASNCACTCSTGWSLQGTSCIATTATSSTTTTTTTTATTNTTEPSLACVSSDYSDWSECLDGIKSKKLLTTANCIGDSVLIMSCTVASEVETTTNPTTTTTTINYCNADRPYLDVQNKDNCENSKGTWNTSNCVCTCPTKYHLSGTSCVYVNIDIENTCTSFEYSEWSECVSGKQTRSISKKLPDNCTGGSPDVVERYCIVSTTCTEDKWVCGEWSNCLTGTQKRTCTLSSDCKAVVNESPKTEQTCISQTTTVNYCKYTYTDWGDCANGKQYRQIATRLPSGCTETTTEALSRICESSSSTCQYTYSDWSSCVDGKRTRTVISKYPTTCSGGPILEESCVSSTDQVSDECISIGWNNKSDCDAYTYKIKVVADCKANNLTTLASCREYIINKYGKPSKCNDISGVACDNLIDNVILVGFSDTISAEVKNELYGIAGSSAVIDTQQKTITVQVESALGETPQSKEVSVEDMPLASSNLEQVSVNLLSTSSISAQDNLSPVGIAFDTDGDGLPDDIEKRLGTDPNKKDTDGDGVDDNQELKNGTSPLDPLAKTTTIVLSGIDKAVVDGKTLEQPKNSTSIVSESLTVNSVETVKSNEKSNLMFQGKAEPNQVITLFIYSVMPIVVTVQADSNGNWVYELDKTLIDGTHEAYVAINDDEGKIIETSLPTPFFIAEAQAVSVDNFVSTGDASQVPDKTNNMMILYVLGGIVVMLVLIAAILIIRQRYSE